MSAPESVATADAAAAEPVSLPERPDVFVSYSRADADFVRRLDAALRERGKDVWVDWEDIRKGADWRMKVELGIESTRAVVAVLSPDFATSRICAEEIEAALAQNKRVVPLLRRELDATALRPELARINWISFADDVGFEQAVSELVDTLETDGDWLDAHARLLVRAREWERAARNSSFLLRGSDLAAAESWLAAQASHREQATPLQAEYIVASRRAATRRQRITLGAVVVAVVVTAALAALAWLQRNTAIANEHTARSRELAVASAAQLRVDPELALLLALEAADTSRTPQAIVVLRRALVASRVRRTFAVGAPVDDVALSPDGTLLRAQAHRGVRVWETATGARRDRGAFPAAPKLAPPLRRPCGAHELLGHAESRDGRLLAVACSESPVRVYARTGGGRRWRERFRIPTPGVLPYTANVALAFDPRAGRLAFAVTPYFGESGGRLGERAAEVWDTRRGRRLAWLRGHSSLVDSVAFDASGQRVVTGSDDKTARVWNAAAGRTLLVLRGHGGPVTSAVFGPGDIVATGSADGTARLWDVAPPRPSAQVRLGRVLPAWAHPLRAIARGGTRAVSADGRRAVVEGPRLARVVELPSRTTVASLHWGKALPEQVILSGDGRRVLTIYADARVVGGFGPPVIWDADTGRRLATLGRDAFTYAGAFDASGERVVTGGEDGIVRLWRADDGQPLERVGRGVGRIVAVAFAPDGKYVAAASRDTTARVWQLGAATAPILLTGHQDDVTGVAFSPQGDLVVTSSGDATARVWDAGTGEQLLAVPGPDPAVPPASFSADGEGVITLRERGDVLWARLYPCVACGDADAVIARARLQATRGLSPAERRAFLGG